MPERARGGGKWRQGPGWLLSGASDGPVVASGAGGSIGRRKEQGSKTHNAGPRAGADLNKTVKVAVLI
jgi:hypothetical protein